MIVSLALIAALAIVGLILVGLSQRLPSQEQQGQNQHQPAAQNPASNEKGTSEKEYQASGWTKIKQAIERNEKVVTALSTAVIAAFTIALVLATGFLYFSSEKVADAAKDSAEAALKQIKLMEADQRPWVSAKAEIVGDVTFSPSQAQIPLRITMSNSGKSPALFAIPRTKVFPFLKTSLPAGKPIKFDNILLASEPAKDAQTFCDTQASDDTARRNGGVIFGDPIFPGEHLEKEAYEFGRIWRKDIDEARTRSPDEGIKFYIVICVDYFSASSDRIHQTVMAYDVQRKDPRTLNWSDALGFEATNETIPNDEVRLNPQFYSGGFAH